jgi:cobalt-zinc-cadmium efflux system membrane fusion protein
MIRTRCILFVLALALAGIVQAESIPVTQGEIDNLGIRFETPSPATEVAAAEVTARVMVPPAGEAVIAASLPGLLTTLSVEVGDSVDEGQALAEMMSPDFLKLQREFLDALNTYRLAETEIERDRQLHDEGIISVRRLQETTTRSMIASTGLNEHRQLLRIAGLTAAEIHSLQTSQALLDSLEIRAPISGVIVERMATTGQRIDAMAPVYRVADLSELWLQLNVPQEQVSNVVPGMTVSGAGFSAEVTTIGRSIDPATQSIIVRARVTSGADALRPGQFLAVQIMAGSVDNTDSAWSVPATAVTRSQDAHYVFVRSEGGIEARLVEVAAFNAGQAIVLSGLSGSESIAISGIAALKAMWSTQEEEDDR